MSPKNPFKSKRQKESTNPKEVGSSADLIPSAVASSSGVDSPRPLPLQTNSEPSSIHNSNEKILSSENATERTKQTENEDKKENKILANLKAGVGKADCTGMNWEPTISPKELEVIGEPCPKPSNGELINDGRVRRNARIVSSNIRRRKLITWMLVFSLLLTWGGFYDLLKRLSTEKDQVFSVIIIKPWLRPGLTVEILLTGIGIFVIIIKMKYMQHPNIRLLYRIAMGFNSFHYLLLLIALPIGVYFFFTELSSNMRNQLQLVTADEPNKISPSWNFTQTERKCCGFHNRTDWFMPEYSDDDEALMSDQEIYYPTSCCNFSLIHNSSPVCTESSHAMIWNRGCHDVEFFILLDYVISTSALLLIAFVLNVSIKLGVFKLERYLLIFRPNELF